MIPIHSPDVGPQVSRGGSFVCGPMPHEVSSVEVSFVNRLHV